MRTIYIDCSIYTLQKSGGISRYLDNVLAHVTLYPHFRFVLVSYGRSDLLGRFEVYPNVSVFERSRSELFCDLLLGFRCLDTQKDTFFSPYMMRSAAQSVLVVHDLIRLSSIRSRIKNWCLKKAIQNANKLVSVSQATGLEINQLYGKQSIVIHNGGSFVDVVSKRTPGIESLIPFWLFVGSRAVYKNFDYFLKEFSNSDSFPTTNLVVVGGGEWTKNEVQLIEKLKLGEKIKKMDKVDDQHLAGLYQAARALVYPSSKEGFGIPVVEAQSLQCPVLLADIPPLREVAGQYGIFFETKRVGALAAAMNELSRSNFDSTVLELAQKRANGFCWEKTAKALWNDVLLLNS